MHKLHQKKKLIKNKKNSMNSQKKKHIFRFQISFWCPSTSNLFAGTAVWSVCPIYFRTRQYEIRTEGEHGCLQHSSTTPRCWRSFGCLNGRWPMSCVRRNGKPRYQSLLTSPKKKERYIGNISIIWFEIHLLFIWNPLWKTSIKIIDLLHSFI